MAAVIRLPAKSPQTAFNLKRWEEMCADPERARIEERLHHPATNTADTKRKSPSF